MYMAVPRLAEREPFFLLDPDHLGQPPRKAASISGAPECPGSRLPSSRSTCVSSAGNPTLRISARSASGSTSLSSGVSSLAKVRRSGWVSRVGWPRAKPNTSTAAPDGGACVASVSGVTAGAPSTASSARSARRSTRTTRAGRTSSACPARLVCSIE